MTPRGENEGTSWLRDFSWLPQVIQQVNKLRFELRFFFCLHDTNSSFSLVLLRRNNFLLFADESNVTHDTRPPSNLFHLLFQLTLFFFLMYIVCFCDFLCFTILWAFPSSISKTNKLINCKLKVAGNRPVG